VFSQQVLVTNELFYYVSIHAMAGESVPVQTRNNAVRKGGKSIKQMLLWGHQITAGGLQLSGLQQTEAHLRRLAVQLAIAL